MHETWYRRETHLSQHVGKLFFCTTTKNNREKHVHDISSTSTDHGVSNPRNADLTVAFTRITKYLVSLIATSVSKICTIMHMYVYVNVHVCICTSAMLSILGEWERPYW